MSWKKKIVGLLEKAAEKVVVADRKYAAACEKAESFVLEKTKSEKKTFDDQAVYLANEKVAPACRKAVDVSKDACVKVVDVVRDSCEKVADFSKDTVKKTVSKVKSVKKVEKLDEKVVYFDRPLSQDEEINILCAMFNHELSELLTRVNAAGVKAIQPIIIS